MLNLLKKIAYERATKKTIDNYEEMVEYLKQYWSAKYSLPDNHPLLLSKTFDEILLEYYIDIFKTDDDFLKKYEMELTGQKAIDEDEDWFKQEMGENYTPPDKAISNVEDPMVFSDNYETG